MSSLRDQVALITGSSRGIGAAIAKSSAQQGAKVVVHGRDGAALSSIRKEIELAGGRSMQVSGDVTNFTDVEAARLRIEGEFGPVDILVASAGGSFTPPARWKIRAKKVPQDTAYREKSACTMRDSFRLELSGTASNDG
jgi:3-oxoacyl-[acyl-carrier protein] reductase